MVRSTRIQRLIARYGRTVTLEDSAGEKETAKAMIQPLRYKNKMYLEGSFLPPGYLDGGHYLYLGEASLRLDLRARDTVIKTDEESYLLKSGEKVCIGDEVLYIWAVLQPYVEDTLERGENLAVFD